MAEFDKDLEVTDGMAKISSSDVGEDHSDSDSEVYCDAMDNSQPLSHLSPIEKNIEKALEAKESGNAHFRTKQYDEAIQEYSNAISFCPDDEANKETRSVFYANRAAAYFSVEEYDQVVEDCTQSLELNPTYIKVLMRRCQAFEKLDRTDEALGDAKKVAELDPSFPKIGKTVQRLEKESEEKMAKLKDEALGKLKDLGNSILGNFGMSLDNFKMTQDPATGGWSVSMNNGK